MIMIPRATILAMQLAMQVFGSWHVIAREVVTEGLLQGVIAMVYVLH
jgi:hypothetical protein